MGSTFLARHSIKTRVTLSVLAIFVLSICALAFTGNRLLHRDMQSLLGAQQVALASTLAQELNGELENRLVALSEVAPHLAQSLEREPAELEASLERLPVLRLQFNDGLFVTGLDGRVLASLPASAGRAGQSYQGREFLSAALEAGKATVGRPIYGQPGQAPLIAMAAPIRDAQGRIAGAVVGMTDLARPNFLTTAMAGQHGRGGARFLVSRQARVILATSDPDRLLEVLPAAGVSPWIDRFMGGFEGTAVVVNPHGLEVLVSVKQVPLADGYASVILPTAEAFAPLRAMQRRMLLATILLTVAVGGLTWWTLRRQLSPMLATLNTLARMADPDAAPEPLPITGEDEIGDLIAGFNRLLAALKLRAQALHFSERRSLAIIEASPTPLVLSDAAGTITFLNKAFTQTVGYSAAQLPTLAQWPALAFPEPSYREWVANTWRQHQDAALRSGAPFVPLELNIRCQDGALRTFMGSAAALAGPAAGSHLLILYDISERKRLEAQLHQSQKMESLGGLAGGVAHDMNNVLGAILGLASVHAAIQPQGGAAQAAFSTIMTACERGASLIRRLLGFTRQGLAEERVLDLNQLIRDQSRLLESTILARVRLDLDLAPALRPLRGDGNALSHMLLNLWVNAVDAMTVDPTLTLRTRNLEGGWIELEVRDNGAGMAPEVLDKALDPYFTTKEQGKGAGLGLSIAHGTVKAHQGKLELLSQPGEGTRVLLRFPACEPTIMEPLASAPPARAGLPFSLRILVVDDDEMIVSTLEMILESLGHSVVAAVCGEAALERLAAGFEPDLVILDMNMPGLGGVGTLPRLRALRPDLPVLLATGRADQTALNLVAAHPHVTLLAKPFGMQELRARLELLAKG